MLIGSRTSFGIELTPVEPSWERRHAPEAAAWAGLSIWVDGLNLCRHVLRGEDGVRSAFFVPLGPLADWFVRSRPALVVEERLPNTNLRGPLHDAVRRWSGLPPPPHLDEDAWLDLRADFWSRHFVLAGAEGAWLPNLAMIRQDERVRFSWAAAPFAREGAVAMLHPAGEAEARWAEVDAAFGSFVEEVERDFTLRSLQATFPWMGTQWRTTATDSAALALYCGRSVDDLARLLGVEPAHVVESVGLGAGEEPAASALAQVLRDLSPAPPQGVANDARRALDDSSARGSARPAWLERRAEAADAAQAGETLERQGQLAAQTLRTSAKLDGEPIGDLPALLERHGVAIRRTETEASHERMVVAASRSGAPVASVLRSRRTNTSWGERFELARALGHALLDPLRGDGFGAASSAWAQDSRRRRSGAFAAELLLPESALERASDGELDGACDKDRFAQLLQTYGVGARTAAHQLHNHGWLSNSTLRDELIEEFSHGG